MSFGAWTTDLTYQKRVNGYNRKNQSAVRYVMFEILVHSLIHDHLERRHVPLPHPAVVGCAVSRAQLPYMQTIESVNGHASFSKAADRPWVDDALAALPADTGLVGSRAVEHEVAPQGLVLDLPHHHRRQIGFSTYGMVPAF